MSDFFQQHKRYLVGYLIAFFVFLIAWALVGAIFGGDSAGMKRSLRRYQRDIQARPSGVNLAELRTQVERQQEALIEMAGGLARDPGEFTLEGAGEPDLHYNARVEDLLGLDRLERFALRDIGFDESLGRPDRYPASAAEFEWYLRGLDVVDQMMAWILEADRSTLNQAIARVEKVSIQPLPKRPRRRTGAAPFVTRHPVEFTIVGHPIGISYLLKRMAVPPEPGRFLALEEARIESLDEVVTRSSRRGRSTRDPLDSGRVRARIRVAALDVREEELGGEGSLQ